MKRACVCVVDAAHARLFTYAETEDEGPVLRDERKLESPGRQDKRNMFSDAASQNPGTVGTGGRGDMSHKGGHGTVDDHRADHIAELDARFSKTIVAEIATVLRDQKISHVILVAAPKMLGVLRKETPELTKAGGVTLTELDQNLSHMSLAQVQEQLAKQELIGARQRPETPRRAGGAR